MHVGVLGRLGAGSRQQAERLARLPAVCDQAALLEQDVDAPLAAFGREVERHGVRGLRLFEAPELAEGVRERELHLEVSLEVHGDLLPGRLRIRQLRLEEQRARQVQGA